MKTSIRGGVSTSWSIPAEQQVPWFKRSPTREEQEAELEKIKVLLAEAEKKGDDYSVGVTKLVETCRTTTASTKTGTSATAEVPGTNTDTSTTPVPQRPRTSSLAVRYDLTIGYKF